MISIKKVGIVTLNGYYNFGNKLQNYALTKYIERKGYEVDTIWSGEEISLKSKIRYFIIKYVPYNKKWKRERKFYLFSKKHISKIDYKKKIINNYNIFIAGSDQVWNYESVKSNVNYLIPFSANQKLISYAASLGNSFIPEEYVSLYKDMLNRFDFISVRELSGKVILENTIGLKNKSIEVLIDPTMLINAAEWNQIEKKPSIFQNKKYILLYFLGYLDEKSANIIFNYARKNELEVIDLLNIKDPFYVSGPEEFIYLVHHASLVCTDSFHSSVFSFIYDIPFIVFKRKGVNDKMYSRLDNLIATFKLDNREYNGYSITLDNINANYSQGKKILKNEIDKAKIFIDNALK